MAHSTGHPDRLNRPGFVKAINGRISYSKEELVAEMAACFLCGEAAINSNAGFANLAASQAQKAANYILGRNKTVKGSTNAEKTRN